MIYKYICDSILICGKMKRVYYKHITSFYSNKYYQNVTKHRRYNTHYTCNIGCNTLIGRHHLEDNIYGTDTDTSPSYQQKC